MQEQKQSRLPERKQNRLRGYDYSNYGSYFITICTQEQKCVLSRLVGDGALDVPRVELTKIGSIAEKYILSGKNVKGISILHYVIMPNHIHFLLHYEGGESPLRGGTSGAPSPTDPTISQLFQQAESNFDPPSPTNAVIPRFVAAFKRFCHQEAGHKVFQRSYHDHIIRSDREYEKICNYIVNNPAHWKLDCFYTADQ